MSAPHRRCKPPSSRPPRRFPARSISAADRFRQSVAEVKEMASQVQHELEATRQELRRGVLELPKETSETADAMRQVVSDQIRALKELAALVSDSGAASDVAEPAMMTAPPAPAGHKPASRTASGRNGAPGRRCAAARRRAFPLPRHDRDRAC